MGKTALVLEGGGLRGIFTAGVIDCFLDNDIKFDYVIGVSAGACNALAYLGQANKYMYESITQTGYFERFYGLGQMIESHRYVDLDKMFDEYTVMYNYDYNKFIENPTKWEMVVTNMETGKAEYMNSKELDRIKLIGKASCSLPLLTEPRIIDGVKYLDGGIADSIPTKRAIDLGFDKIVVVLTRMKGSYSKINKATYALTKKAYGNYPNFVEATKNRTELYRKQVDYTEELEKEGKVFLIRPTFKEVGRLERNMDEITLSYYHAYTKTKMSMKKLKEFLED